MQIPLIEDFKVQHNLRINYDSRGIRTPHPDWTIGGAGHAGVQFASEKCINC